MASPGYGVCMGIICCTIVVLGPCLTEAVTYHRKMTPERVRVGETVRIEAWMEDYTQPIGRVDIVNSKYSTNVFSVISGGCGTNRLRFNQTAYSDVAQILCDHDNAKYSFRILKVLGDATLYGRVVSQVPATSQRYHILPYLPPTGVYLSKTPGVITVGDQLEIRCNFRGGRQNLGNFTLERFRTTEPLTPDGSQQYGDMYSIKWPAEPGDEGWYRCKAVYDPVSVGEYISSPVYVNVVYAPQLDYSEDLVDYIEAEIGQNATFSIPILANPDADATWTRGTELLENDDRFHIAEWDVGPGEHEFALSFFVKEGDYGLYKCEVDNSQGTQLFYFHLARKAPKNVAPQAQWTGANTALVIIIVILIVVILGGVAGLWFLIFLRMRQRKQASDRASFASNPGFQPDDEEQARPQPTARAAPSTSTQNPTYAAPAPAPSGERVPPLPPKSAKGASVTHQVRARMPPPEPTDDEYEDMSGLRL